MAQQGCPCDWNQSLHRLLRGRPIWRLGDVSNNWPHCILAWGRRKNRFLWLRLFDCTEPGKAMCCACAWGCGWGHGRPCALRFFLFQKVVDSCKMLNNACHAQRGGSDPLWCAGSFWRFQKTSSKGLLWTPHLQHMWTARPGSPGDLPGENILCWLLPFCFVLCWPQDFRFHTVLVVKGRD